MGVHAGSAVCGSSRPYGLEPARLLYLWDSPGMNTGAGCPFLLQGTSLLLPTQGSKLRLVSPAFGGWIFTTPPAPPPRKHARLGAATNGRGSERVSNLPEIMPLGVSGSKHRSPAQVQVKLWAGVLDSGVHGPQQAGRSQSARPVSPGGDKVSLGSGSQGQARRVVKGQGGHSAGSWWLSLTLVLAPLMESGGEAGDGNRGGVCRAQDPQVPLA